MLVHVYKTAVQRKTAVQADFSSKQFQTQLLPFWLCVDYTQQTQNICMKIVQQRPSIVQMLYKCFVFAGYNNF